MTPSPVCSRPWPHPAAQHHPEAHVVNPDASRSFVVRDDGQIALHASAARESSPDSVGRPLVARTLAPLVHSRPHNKSDHGRSGCRPKPELGTEHCPGILAQHGVGARRRYETWQLRSAPCLSQSTQQVARTQCVLATPKSRARRAMACGYVDNARALPTYPQAQQQPQPASI
jgi:hypothetical protein